MSTATIYTILSTSFVVSHLTFLPILQGVRSCHPSHSLDSYDKTPLPSQGSTSGRQNRQVEGTKNRKETPNSAVGLRRAFWLSDT